MNLSTDISLLRAPERSLPRLGTGLALALALAALLVAAPATAEAAEPPCDRATAAGITTHYLTVNGAQRRYNLRAPAGLQPGVRYPVIIGLHGGSGTAEGAERQMGLTSSRRAYYLYPQGNWPNVGRGWNVDPRGHDFPFFDALMAHLKTKACIDPTRVSAAGMSNGGFMANALACHRPGMLRRIGSVAGGGPSSECPLTRSVGAMVIHGTGDTVVPIRSARYTRDYWLVRNAYRNAAPVGYNPPPCLSYPGVTKPVIWCRHSGGHVWPSWAGVAIRDFFLG